MFGSKDKATIREVWETVSGHVWDRHEYTATTPESEIDGQSLFESTSDLCWEFLKGAKTAQVILPNGKSTPAKPQLFECLAPWSDVGVHLSLKLGTVGSGNASTIYGREVDLAGLYGESRHCFIYVSKRELEVFASELAGTISSEKQTAPPLSDRIVEYHDANPWAKRDDIEAALKGSVSGNQFDASWKLASKKRPAISAGGRPKARKPKP